MNIRSKSVKKGKRTQKSPWRRLPRAHCSRNASRKLGLQPLPSTMRLAQQLYEGVDLEGEGAVGLVTYIAYGQRAHCGRGAVSQAREYIEKTFGPQYCAGKAELLREQKPCAGRA